MTDPRLRWSQLPVAPFKWILSLVNFRLDFMLERRFHKVSDEGTKI